MAEDNDINEAQGLFAPLPPGSDFDMGKGLDTGGFDPSDIPPILDGPFELPIPGPIDVPPNLPDWNDLPTPGPIGIPPFPGGWHPGGEPEPIPGPIGERIGDIFEGRSLEDMYRDGTLDINDEGFIPNVKKFEDGVGGIAEDIFDKAKAEVGDIGHSIGDRLGGAAGIVDGDQVGHTLAGSASAAAAAAGIAGKAMGAAAAAVRGSLGGGGGPVQQGMNRAQAQSVVEALTADRANLQSLIEAAAHSVHALEQAWKGPDSQRFASEFASSRKQMDQAVHMIEQMAKTLTAQIGAQEGTSNH